MKLTNFNKVYDQYYLLVMKIAYEELEDYHYAQDVCQEVFVTLYKKADIIEENTVKAWLIVAAKRKAIDLRRKKYIGREVCKKEEEIMTHVDVRPEHTVLKKEFGCYLFQELKKRDSQWFEIIRRVSVEQENAGQVASDMGISLSYLRTKLCRAKTWIRENFGDDYSALR